MERHESRRPKFEEAGRQLSDEQRHDENQTRADYLPPQILVVGKAVNLVRSYSSGKYSDGYTGYYWER